jgi:WD40 repeat protein
MNTRSLGSLIVPSVGVRAALLLISALLGASATAMGDEILVADPNGTNGVSSYQMDGTLINSSLIPGTTYQGLAMSGLTLYIANPGPGTTNNGQVLQSTFAGNGTVISTSFFALGGGLTAPYGLVTTATNVFVGDFNTGNILKYDFSGTQLASINVGLTDPYGLAVSGDTLWESQATTGAGMNTIEGFSISAFTNTPTFTITSDLDLPHGLAVSGSILYVANGGDGTIWSFDATTGTPISEVVSGLTNPQGLMVSGTDLYVSSGDGTVKGFDATTGDPLVGFTTITGLSSPDGIVIAPMGVPEPSTYAVLAGVLALGLAGLSRRARKTA